ncbi:MAG: oligosaccharide flippase family protein [Coriobacteriia bacterium]|nr:oligosaccharide flippase family protein [Coriobacteriia bacterium]
MFKEIKRVFKDSVIYGMGGLLPKVVGVVLVPIYTRFLLPADYGLMSLASMVTTMTGVIMMLGQNGSLTLFFRSSQTDNSEDEVRSLLFSVVTFTLMFTGLVLTLLLLLGPALMPYLFPSGQIAFNPYLVVALCTATFGIPLGLLQAVNRARGQALTHTVFQLTNFALNTGFTIYFVVALRQGALGSLKGTMVAAALLLPVALWLIGREMRPHFSWMWLKKSILFGVPLVPHYFAGWILTFADRYMLERYRSLSEVGLYSLAYNISMILNLVATSINQAWGPVYYDLAATDEGRAKLPRLTTVYATAVTAAAIAYMLLSRELLLLLAAPKYHAAAGLVPIVAAGYYFFALYSVLSTGIFYARKTKWVPLISAIAAALNIGLNLWLMPRFGMWAAAWNTLAAFALMALSARMVSGHLIKGSFEDVRLAKLVAVFAVAFAANLGIESTSLHPAISLTLKLVLLVAALASFPALDIVSPAEIRAFIDRIRKRPSRNLTIDEAAAVEAQAGEVDGGDSGAGPGDSHR